MKPVAPLRQSNSPIITSVDAAPHIDTLRLTLDQVPIAPVEPRASIRKTAAVWEVVVFRATTATLALYIGWVCGDALGLWSAAQRVPIVTQILLVLLSASAAVLAMGASSRPSLGRATRRAWQLFAAAQVATGIVSISWVVRMAAGSTAAGSLALQLTAAAYDVFLLCALLTFPVRRLQASDRATFWFDSAIVAGVAAVLTWHLLLRTALIAAGSDWRTSIYALTYPVADIVLLFATVVLLLRRPLSGSVRRFASSSSVSSSIQLRRAVHVGVHRKGC